MDRDVNDTDMQRVIIKEGWLVEQFARYVLGQSSGPPYPRLVNLFVGRDEFGMPDYVALNEEFSRALQNWDALVVQKNVQYEDAWQQDGPVTALADLKDKLYRLSSATRSGAAISWDPEKRKGTLFDIIVRSMMILAWTDLNFVDDDDDRLQKS